MVFKIMLVNKFGDFKFGELYMYNSMITYYLEYKKKHSIFNSNYDIIGYLEWNDILDNFVRVENWESDLQSVDNLFNFYMDHNLG